MNDRQIQQMVDRFLVWELPPSLNNDGGSKLTGTHLLDATQAEQMIRFITNSSPIMQDDDKPPYLYLNI